MDAIGSGPELAVILCGIMGCWVLGKMDIRTKEQLLGKGIRVVDTKKICSEGFLFHGRGDQALTQAAQFPEVYKKCGCGFWGRGLVMTWGWCSVKVGLDLKDPFQSKQFHYSVIL